jgi:uncharacterized repeat protein (TIGR01451 family)
MWICCNEKLFKKLQIFGGAKTMTQRHRTINNSKFKTTGDKIMKTNSNNRTSTIRTVARTWIVTPIIATSFLIGTAPSFATIDNTATATGTPSSGTLANPTSNTVAIPVASGNPSLSVAKSVFAGATIAGGIDPAITDAGDTITYQYILTNNGNQTLTSVVPVDPKPKFGPSQILGTGTFGAFTLITGTTTLTPTGPTNTSTYRAVYTLSQLDIDRAGGIVAGPTAVNNSALATGVRPNSTTYTATIPGTAVTAITAYPKLTVAKTFSLADVNTGTNTAGNADVGEVITYTYTVKNVGNVAINNVSITDNHEGTNIVPASLKIIGETLTSDGPLATPDSILSTDTTANNAIWSVLQPGATITFTYTHTVTQAEFDAG